MSIHSGAVFTGASAPAINNAGAVVFHAGSSDREGMGVYLWEEGFVTPIAIPGERFQQAYAPQIDDAGRVVFVGRTGRGDALYRWENGQERPIIAAGDPIPGVGRLRWLDLNRRQPFRLNARGAVAFTGDVGGRAGIFLWDADGPLPEGRIRPVAIAGLAHPGIGQAAEVGSLSPTEAAPAERPGPRMATRPPGYPPGASAPFTGPRGMAPPGNPYSYGSPRGLPGGPYGYGVPPGAGGPYGPYGGYGPPGGGPGASGSFGLALSDAGHLHFAATLRGRQSVVLATPKGK
jgi:hypothetical protein